MIFGGMGLLAISLKPISTILATVGGGRLHRSWATLRILVILFTIGYATFGALSINSPPNIANLVVSVILLAGGGFVLVVAQLSAVTTIDIIRVASLERDVVRDPLTGLFNRRYMKAKLEDEAARARRSENALSALLIDLDHFKHINDTYGHLVGDFVLTHVANLIVRCSRVTDTVVRYGGEEFLVITPHTDLAEARVLGERLLKQLANDRIALPDGRHLTVTASIGAACLAFDEAMGDFLSRADEALYVAKRTGRNRFCSVDGNMTVQAA